MKTTFDKHKAAIVAGTVDRSNVIGLRKMLNTYERIRNIWSVSSTSYKMTDAENVWLFDNLGEHKPRVTGELHASGVKLLQSKRYRKQLESVAEIVADLDHFKLVGFEQIGRYGEYHVPVYRAYDTKGASFPFMNIPWQSGGNGPQIMPANRY